MAEKEKYPDELTEEKDEAVCETMEADEELEGSEEELEESEPEEEPEGETPKEKPEKKSFFKKKKDKKDIQIEELNDRLMRQMAEFDNFRKRTEKEKSAMFEIGAKSVIEKILPIVDNFERGLTTCSEEERQTPFAQGMEKVYKQLQTTLEALEVTPIEAVGQEFDPNLHNAVMQDEEADVPENTVVAEFQKGYLYRGSVVRYSMVKVRK